MQYNYVTGRRRQLKLDFHLSLLLSVVEERRLPLRDRSVSVCVSASVGLSSVCVSTLLF